jgi:hypothetical protein
VLSQDYVVAMAMVPEMSVSHGQSSGLENVRSERCAQKEGSVPVPHRAVATRLVVHSILSYGIIFWGNSSSSKDIFKIQKRIIRVITNSRRSDSCRELFKQLDILPLQSQYIYSLLLFINKNKDNFLLNSQVHRIYTRQNSNLYLPSANLTIYTGGESVMLE